MRSRNRVQGGVNSVFRGRIGRLKNSGEVQSAGCAEGLLPSAVSLCLFHKRRGAELRFGVMVGPVRADLEIGVPFCFRSAITRAPRFERGGRRLFHAEQPARSTFNLRPATIPADQCGSRTPVFDTGRAGAVPASAATFPREHAALSSPRWLARGQSFIAAMPARRASMARRRASLAPYLKIE